jgi:hypothetical protein
MTGIMSRLTDSMMTEALEFNQKCLGIIAFIGSYLGSSDPWKSLE